MGKKRLDIRIFEEDGHGKYVSTEKTTLDKSEYPNVYLNKDISEAEFNKAIDTIITYFKNLAIRSVKIDLEVRNQSYSQPKKLTLEEIETLLGYDISLVTEKNKR